MKTFGKIFATFIIMLLLAVIGFGVWFVYNKQYTIEDKLNNINSSIDSLTNTVSNIQITTTDSSNNTENTIETKKDEPTYKSYVGTYENTQKTEYYFHSATLEILSQTENTISFKLNSSHGVDAEHINIGEVMGTANKVADGEYEFSEEKEGVVNKIKFTFGTHKIFEWVDVTESFPDSNPYAAENVSFAGNYERVYEQE